MPPTPTHPGATPAPSPAAVAAAKDYLADYFPDGNCANEAFHLARIIEKHTRAGEMRRALEKARDWHAMFPTYANPDMLTTLEAALSAPAAGTDDEMAEFDSNGEA